MYKLFPILLLQLQCTISFTQELPVGYMLQSELNFTKSSSINEFEFSDAETWKISKTGNNSYLELTGTGNYTPPFRSPFSIALISNKMFGDFILEARLKQTGNEYNHRDMCIFFGLRNASNFYYVHLASAADSNAHNIFVVKNAPRAPVADPLTSGINWGENVWHKVRIERNIVQGLIKIYFDDMKTPVMETINRTFVLGYIGFGSFDDSGCIDDIKIWAPTSIEQKAGIFR
ncbi:MAG: hypothetical protein JXJ22_07190 [Bacteroidales bacterium]|nr:hypothetical protein [Bacteroidales bacterium]